MNERSDLARRRVEERDWKPRNCVWELTLGCNLRCLHCGSRAGKVRPSELSTEECLDVVDQLARLGCELITLSGGEPTLRRDWDVIARAIADRGLYANLVTNGAFPSDRAAHAFAQRAIDAGLCNVGVSIDGPRPVHDRVRGVGAFARSIAAIEYLVDAGIPVTILTTVSRLTLPHLREIRQIAIDARARQWRLQLAKPMGAMEDHRDFVIAPTELLGLVPLLARLKKDGGIDLRVGDSIGYYGAPDKVLRGRGWRGRAECWQGCQAGMQAIGIEADGGVKGCLSLQARWDGRDPFVEGNVRESTLDEIWHRPGVFAFNRDFTTDALTGGCAACKHGSMCRGGARCVSAAFQGLLTENEYCFYRVQNEQAGHQAARAGGAAVAAAVLALSLTSGCSSRHSPPRRPGTDAAVTMDASSTGDAMVGQDANGADATVDAQEPVDASGDATVVADGSTQPDGAVDCSAVCCECEYGIIPPEIWDTCCAPDPCAGVCCECDYGAPPPPECCP